MKPSVEQLGQIRHIATRLWGDDYGTVLVKAAGPMSTWDRETAARILKDLDDVDVLGLEDPKEAFLVRYDGIPPTVNDGIEHGTSKGYNQHYYRKVLPVCDPCKAALAAHKRSKKGPAPEPEPQPPVEPDIVVTESGIDISHFESNGRIVGPRDGLHWSEWSRIDVGLPAWGVLDPATLTDPPLSVVLDLAEYLELDLVGTVDWLGHLKAAVAADDS